MAFHFPLMPHVHVPSARKIGFLSSISWQTPSIADNCQWALFLRIHDELTLEMVTDEERDYMYRATQGSPGTNQPGHSAGGCRC